MGAGDSGVDTAVSSDTRKPGGKFKCKHLRESFIRPSQTNSSEGECGEAGEGCSVRPCLSPYIQDLP